MSERANGDWAKDNRLEGNRPEGGRFVDNLLRPVMIAGMMACLTAPLVYALQWLGLGYNANHFLIFAF